MQKKFHQSCLLGPTRIAVYLHPYLIAVNSLRNIVHYAQRIRSSPSIDERLCRGGHIVGMGELSLPEVSLQAVVTRQSDLIGLDPRYHITGQLE